MPVTSLYYSVWINTNAFSGATHILYDGIIGDKQSYLCRSDNLTDWKSLTDGKFWTFMKEHRATSFTGVPYSFEVLQKLRFSGWSFPTCN